MIVLKYGGIKMKTFDEKCATLIEEIGEYKKMVLSTSLKDCVTSRMMSIIVFDGIFYFQTDKTSRKYEQLKNNIRASLCIDNIQIEGCCKEVGHPLDNADFLRLYQKHFPNSFERYTQLTNERLFAFEPRYIKKWIYDKGEPYEEIFDFTQKIYEKRKYIGV